MNDIDPEPITAWLALILAFGAVVTLVLGLYARARRQVIHNLEERVTSLIIERTQPIESGYRNEGTSLTDVAHAVDDLTVLVREHLRDHP